MSSSPGPSTSTGACMCGKVTYSVQNPPIINVICHCTHCRRVTGSSFLTSSVFPLQALTITTGSNVLKEFITSNTDSGKPLTRRFCSECGSYLFATTPLANTVSVAAGSLDDVGDWRPGMEVHCGNRANWVPEFEGVDRYVTSPGSQFPKATAPNSGSEEVDVLGA